MTKSRTESHPTGTRRLRVGRRSIERQAYVITAVTASRQEIFRSLWQGRQVVHSMRRLDSLGHVETMAFVVMPDHLHWLVTLTGRRSLSAVAASLKAGATRNLRENCAIEGRVWQRGFHDHAVRSEKSLRAIARYIVANPVRAGLVSSAREYSLWDAIWI